MDRTAEILTFFGVFIGVGFIAGLIFGRPWTRWIMGVLAAWIVVMTEFAHPDRTLVAVPFIVGMGALGYGAATLGIRLRNAATARHDGSPEVRQ